MKFSTTTILALSFSASASALPIHGLLEETPQNIAHTWCKVFPKLKSCSQQGTAPAPETQPIPPILKRNDIFGFKKVVDEITWDIIDQCSTDSTANGCNEFFQSGDPSPADFLRVRQQVCSDSPELCEDPCAKGSTAYYCGNPPEAIEKRS